MRFFELIFDFQNSNQFIDCYSDDDLNFDRYSLQEGNKIDHWDKNFKFYYNPNAGEVFSDYLSNDLSWLVVSEKFKGVLETLEIPNVQFLPVKLENVNDYSILVGYYVVNITSVVDALNLEYSDYTVFELNENEKVLSVKKYALNRSEIKDLHLFRVVNSSMSIFVSEAVKNALETNGITGCDYYEVKVID